MPAPRGRSSVGRASASQAEGRGFEPHRPLTLNQAETRSTSGFRASGWSLGRALAALGLSLRGVFVTHLPPRFQQAPASDNRAGMSEETWRGRNPHFHAPAPRLTYTDDRETRELSNDPSGEQWPPSQTRGESSPRDSAGAAAVRWLGRLALESDDLSGRRPARDRRDPGASWSAGFGADCLQPEPLGEARPSGQQRPGRQRGIRGKRRADRSGDDLLHPTGSASSGLQPLPPAPVDCNWRTERVSLYWSLLEVRRLLPLHGTPERS